MGSNRRSKAEGITATVIIVSYNTRQLTLECLASLFAESPDLSFEVIVVDNDSQDGSAEAIRESFPQVDLRALDRNLGFAAANNFAAKHARGRYLVLLNPDTVVLDRAVERLVDYAKRHLDAGIVGGRTVFPDGSLNPTSCWAKATLWSVFCEAMCLSVVLPRNRFFDPVTMGSWPRDTEREVDIVTGCFLLIATTLFRSLGGFDTSYFMYGEEADLCLRAAGDGRRPVFTPSATVVHLGGASEPDKEDKIVRLLKSQRMLIRTHWPGPQALIGTSLVTFGVWVRARLWTVLSSIGLRTVAERGRCWQGVWRRRTEWG